MTYCSPGSIPEEDGGGKLYNSCTVFGPDGELILKHRKVCVHQARYLFELCNYLREIITGHYQRLSLSLYLSAFSLSRFTSSTSTFQEKSASRSLRRWVQGAVCRCLKHVSGISWLLLCSRQVDEYRFDLCHTLRFLPQRSVKWVWGFATTWGSQSSHSSTAGEVSGWGDGLCGVFSSV